MTSPVFYRKWRPQTLAEVVGQEAVTRTLLNALSSGHISHAYLFCGPRGTGKTSTGRILAKAVNCLSNGKGEPCNTCAMCQAITEGRALDVIEIDAASNTGVDDMRSLREKVNYAPNQARYKVYIIDEVHMLSNSASNALLKTLEEPPPHVIFVLATTEAHKILPTILSRCQHFDFRRLSQADIAAKLAQIGEAEGIHVEPEALRLIARSATGSLRDAENLLQQLTTYYSSEIGLEQVRAVLGITGDWRVKELAKHIVSNDIPAGMATINSVNNDGLDLRQFHRELVAYLRALLLTKSGAAESTELTTEDLNELKDLAAKATLAQILKAVKLFGQLQFTLDNYSTLPLELAMVDCALATEEEQTSPAAKPIEAEPRPPRKIAATPAPPVRSRPPVAKAVPASAPAPVKTTPASVPPRVTPAMPTPVMSPIEAGTDIERLKLNWKLVIQQAPPDIRGSAAVAILRSGVKPVSIENDTVCLALKHPIHKEQIEKIENQRVVERVISNFLGRPCHVQCILEENHLLKEALKLGAQITHVEEK